MYFTTTSFLVTLGVIAIAAISYAALAHAFVRRRGLRILWPIWLLASVTAAGALIASTVITRPDHTLADALTGPFSPAVGFLLMWALGFGAVSLLVAGRQRRGELAFGVSLAAGSFGACLFGVILFWLGLGVFNLLTF